MTRMADFAEALVAAGHDQWSIVRELRNAADEAHFGWSGAQHFGTTAGPVPPSECEELIFRVDQLIDENPRARTVPKESLIEAIDL